MKRTGVHRSKVKYKCSYQYTLTKLIFISQVWLLKAKRSTNFHKWLRLRKDIFLTILAVAKKLQFSAEFYGQTFCQPEFGRKRSAGKQQTWHHFHLFDILLVAFYRNILSFLFVLCNWFGNDLLANTRMDDDRFPNFCSLWVFELNTSH